MLVSPMMFVSPVTLVGPLMLVLPLMIVSPVIFTCPLIMALASIYKFPPIVVSPFSVFKINLSLLIENIPVCVVTSKLPLISVINMVKF